MFVNKKQLNAEMTRRGVAVADDPVAGGRRSFASAAFLSAAAVATITVIVIVRIAFRFTQYRNNNRKNNIIYENTLNVEIRNTLLLRFAKRREITHCFGENHPVFLKLF